MKTIIAALVVPLAALIGLLLMQRLEATLLPPAAAPEDLTTPPEPDPPPRPHEHPAPRPRHHGVHYTPAGCAHPRHRTHARPRRRHHHPLPADPPALKARTTPH
ncbi:hypothetical protein [Thermomonospora cellulosilytica]|uniref:Uncharacterized protein n=1 Tax=Thermomonospora cellulosilytica TaxID=1411118 RepID=A0A7W3R5J1_9ACTN|nr:hypothetical protein [Thermomonospora cellulosilytica]MBA9001168.1 hypothetical protein [Thermomonospora cellulosilytica]